MRDRLLPIVSAALLALGALMLCISLLSGDPLHLGEMLPPLLALAAYVLFYVGRARTLARQGRPVASWRMWSFISGVLLMTVVQIGPLDTLADELLLAHVVQHIIIGDIATLLVVLGLTGPVMQPLLSTRASKLIRPLAHPVVALVLWTANIYIWHVPFLYQEAIRVDLVHALEHACLFWFGLLLWIALIGPLPKPAWFGSWARLGYVVAVRLAGASLANAFIWLQTVFYPYYRASDVHAGLNPLSDQNIAGGVMMIEQILLTTGLLAWLFIRASKQDEERQSLLDLADERGVELSEQRATIAVADGAGATERLRRRLIEAAPAETGGGEG